MSPISTNFASAPVNFAPGDDLIAVVKAKYAASTEGYRSALETSCDSATGNLAKLAQLKALSEKLANAAKADDGKSVILGSDLAGSNAVKSDIQSLGVSLSTEQRYYISSITGNADGTGASSAHHLATAAEMAAGEAATLIATDSSGTEFRQTIVNGNVTNYLLYKGESVLTASQADVTTLLTQLKAAAAPIESAAKDALARVKAYAGLLEKEKGIPDPTVKLRKREAQSVDSRLQEQSQSVIEASRQRIEDLDRFRQNEAARSNGDGPGNS